MWLYVRTCFTVLPCEPRLANAVVVKTVRNTCSTIRACRWFWKIQKSMNAKILTYMNAHVFCITFCTPDRPLCLLYGSWSEWSRHLGWKSWKYSRILSETGNNVREYQIIKGHFRFYLSNPILFEHLPYEILGRAFCVLPVFLCKADSQGCFDLASHHKLKPLWLYLICFWNTPSSFGGKLKKTRGSKYPLGISKVKPRARDNVTLNKKASLPLVA